MPREIQSVEKLERLRVSTRPRISHPGSSGGEKRGKRKRSTVFLKRTREDQSHKHRDCFKSNVGETYQRHGGAHIGFSKSIDTILN